jgi:hypothetical protein
MKFERYNEGRLRAYQIEQHDAIDWSLGATQAKVTARNHVEIEIDVKSGPKAGDYICNYRGNQDMFHCTAGDFAALLDAS